jgi:hypothetical protein
MPKYSHYLVTFKSEKDFMNASADLKNLDRSLYVTPIHSVMKRLCIEFPTFKKDKVTMALDKWEHKISEIPM